MKKQKTAMFDLKEDLIATIKEASSTLDGIDDAMVSKICKGVMTKTIEAVIKRIDTELFEMEENQIRTAYNQGGKYASEISSRDYFNQDFTQE